MPKPIYNPSTGNHEDVSNDNPMPSKTLSVAAGADPHASSGWSITATADNLAATVTRAAEAGKSHYITGLAGSFSAAVAGRLLTLADGGTTIGNFYVHNQLALSFEKPIKLTANSAAALSLAASGTVGQIGAVTLMGYTL